MIYQASELAGNKAVSFFTLERALEHMQNFQLRLCYALLLALTLTACQQAPPRSQRPAPLPQDPFVEVYFNHEPSAEYTEPYLQRGQAPFFVRLKL